MPTMQRGSLSQRGLHTTVFTDINKAITWIRDNWFTPNDIQFQGTYGFAEWTISKPYVEVKTSQRIFYHVTTRRRLPFIRRLGLQPSTKDVRSPAIYLYPDEEAMDEAAVFEDLIGEVGLQVALPTNTRVYVDLFATIKVPQLGAVYVEDPILPEGILREIKLYLVGRR